MLTRKQALFSPLQSSTDLFRTEKKNELGEEHTIHACCLRVVIVMKTYFILLVKMRNLSRNGSGQGIKLEEGS